MGDQGQRIRPVPPGGPPVFNADKFAFWFDRHIKVHKLSVPDLARAAGFGSARLLDLRRGGPQPRVVELTGQKGLTPSVNTIAGLSWALHLSNSFVLSRGGIGEQGERFTEAERDVLADLLGGRPEEIDDLLQELVDHHKTRGAV